MKKNNISWQKEIFKNKELMGKVIAICDNKIIESANSYQELIKKINKIKSYRFFSVPKNPEMYRILTLKIKSIKKHSWLPVYPIKFFADNNKIYEQEALIDSGADISLINHAFGKLIGLKTTPHEILLSAEGIGGVVSYFLREIKMEIDGHKFSAPVAWLTDSTIKDMIIGREVVFDIFNIEFKQSEEKIVFRKKHP